MHCCKTLLASILLKFPLQTFYIMRTRTLQGTDPCTGTQGLWPEYSPVAQSTFVLAPGGGGTQEMVTTTPNRVQT